MVVLEVPMSPVLETTISCSFSKAKSRNPLNGRGLYRSFLSYWRKVKVMSCQDAEINCHLGLETVTIFNLRWGYFGLGCCIPVMSQQVCRRHKAERVAGRPAGGTATQGEQDRPRKQTWGRSCPWASKVPLWQKRPTALIWLVGAELLPELVKY